MKFKINDIVKIIDDKEVFYHGAIGTIKEIDNDEYHVFFEAIDIETGEEFVYEECYYLEGELELYKGDNK